jgi:hypothetical protein
VSVTDKAAADARDEAMRNLRRAPYPSQQKAFREQVPGLSDDLDALVSVYLQNPFFRLTDDEVATLIAKVGHNALTDLISARHSAMRAPAQNFGVFSMPKSGSTFLKSALQEALQVRFVSLIGFGAGALLSHFGINSREQELDELALVKASVLYPNGFVCQQHTRYTQYLALQLRAYRIKPIVGIRNILDALVSFDDMMVSGRTDLDESVANDPHNWVADTQFPLPRGYVDLSPDARFRVLGPSYGIWLIQFHLSWLRGKRQGIVNPMIIRYEEDILDPPRLVTRLTETLKLTEPQAQRLASLAEQPDPSRSRFNVGKAGRGREHVPDDVRQSLLDYARIFASEIPEEDIAYLLG